MGAEETLQKIEKRWEDFRAKVEQRVGDLLSEADPALDEIIATEPLDPAPLSGALSELRARMLGIVKKVDEAFEKLDGELDALNGEAAIRLREALIHQRQTLSRSIQERCAALSARKALAGARALRALADAEMTEAAVGSRCASCGAPMDLSVLAEPSQVVCGNCNALNTFRPGPATLLFFQGPARKLLAEDAKVPELKKPGPHPSGV